MNYFGLSTALLSATDGLGLSFDKETLAQAGTGIVIGLGMVFAVLAILWGVLTVFKLIFAGRTQKAAAPKQEKAPAAPTPAPTAPAPVVSDDAQLIAVLTAAVAAYREAEGTASSTGFRVVSFRREQGGRSWNAN